MMVKNAKKWLILGLFFFLTLTTCTEALDWYSTSLFAISELTNPNDDDEDEDVVKNENVIDLITKNPSYTRFANALRKTGLSKVLLKEKELTAFVPNDEAFDNAAPEIIAIFEESKNSEQLKEILMDHFISESIHSKKIKEHTLKTLRGNSLEISIIKPEIKNTDTTNMSLSNSLIKNSSNQLMINEETPQKKIKVIEEITIQNAKVTKPNIRGVNGLIHEIDAIILFKKEPPPEKQEAEDSE